MTIRAFDPTRDYPAIVAIFNANFPTFTETEAEFRYGDNYREEKHHFARVVAEENGVVVGYGQSQHDTHSFHPTKFDINVQVALARQGEGIGKRLFDHVVAELASLSPTVLRSYTIEGTERALRFLQDRGFVEELRYSESWLDVPAFDASRFPEAEAHVLSQNLRIASFAELGEADPVLRHKLYEFAKIIQADIPSPEPYTPVAYEVWEKRFERMGYLPEAQFLALDGDEFVGMSTLWGREADDHLQTGATGVIRSHRRRGIALALKLRAIAFAKQRNAPINRALGFVPQPGWIGFVKTVY